MCFSGNPWPLSSTIFSHVWNILVVYSMLSLSMSDWLNNFPKHLIAWSSYCWWDLLNLHLDKSVDTASPRKRYVPTLKGPILLVYMSWCCHCEIIHEVSNWWLIDPRIYHWQNPHSHYKQDRGDGISREYPLLYSLPECGEIVNNELNLYSPDNPLHISW